MKKIIAYLFITVCFCIEAFAQRDLPVSGHAAILVDLLKKDYAAIDVDNRKDEISRDRTLIISIFKSYLTDQDKLALKGMDDKRQQVNLEKITSDLNIEKKKYSDYAKLSSSSELKDTNALKNAAEETNKISGKLEKAKDKYYAAKFGIDTLELYAVSKRYHDTGNKFLEYAIGLFKEKYVALNQGNLDRFSTTNPSSEVQKSIPFIGGNLAFDTAIDGLAKFLAKRLKQELTTYVIERVKVWLQNPSEDDEFAEFKVLLPKTTSFLIGFTADKVTNFPNEIKQYIEDDLDHILDHTHDLRNTPRIQKLISNYPDLDFAMEALETIPSISKIKSPTDYFTVLEKSRNLYRWKNDVTNLSKHNIANAIYLTGLLARSLSVNENGETKLASVNFLSTYALETNFFFLYAGFLRQQNLKYYNISFIKDSKTASEFLLEDGLNIVVGNNPAEINHSIDIQEYKHIIDEALINAAKNAEKIYNIGQDIKKANQAGKAIGSDTIYNFVDNIIGFSEGLVLSSDSLTKKLIADGDKIKLVQNITSFIVNNNTPFYQRASVAPYGMINGFITDYNNKKKVFKTLDLQGKTAPYFTIARTSNEIMKDLSHKKYATALLKAIEIGSSLSSETRFAQFVSTLRKLQVILADEKTASWHQFIDVMSGSNGTNITLKRDQIDGLKRLSGEIAKLKLFYNINYPDGGLKSDLESLSRLCKQGLLTGIIGGADLSNSALTVNKTDFQLLVLSNDIDVMLDGYLDKVKSEMEAFTIEDNSGKPVKIFSQDDAENLRYASNVYFLALFKSYYIDGNKSENDDLRKKREFLFATISSYLATLPQKFDIGANKNLVSLIHFINDMALAKTSDDVEKAIDAFALPAGSYAIKRQSQFSFTINSYPGVLSAYEVSLAKEAFSVAFTAPVGLGLSWGSKKGSVNGIFIPVIDIGALTRLRLDGDTHTKSLPEFTFKNIFSPGIYYSHGFRKSPLAINIGVQYGPELESFKDDGSILFKKDVFRFGIGLVFDIPLLNLQTRPR